MAALRIVYRALASLTPYARNARTHSLEQVAQIVASMQEFGWTNPVLIDEEGGIVAGHGRVLAAEVLGMGKVPTITLAGLTPAQRRAYVIADNKLALNAGWDEALLAQEIEALRDEGYDLGLTGFSDDELEALLAGEEPPPAAGSSDPWGSTATPVTRVGDTWVLGVHRVRCGDSTLAAEVTALMEGGLADGLWTDPPYNVAYEGVAGKILNDAMSPEQFRAFLLAAFRAALGALRAGAPAYVAHADTSCVDFRMAFAEAGFYVASGLVWVKNALVLGRQDFQMRHEPILYGWKPGAAHTWLGGRKQTTILELDEPSVVQTGPSEYQLRVGEEILVFRGEGITVQRFLGSVLLEDKPQRNDIHPTMKPVALVERMIRNSVKRGGAVLDLFGGGGSTLIACQQSGRRPRLMELDPRFVDAIVRRWELATGAKAHLEDGETPFLSVARDRGVAIA